VTPAISARVCFCLLWTCGLCLRLTVLAVPPVISMIQRDLHLSGTEIGLLSGIPVVVFAIVATPGSIMIARIGVRGALLCGLLIAAAGTLVRSGAADAWQLYLTSVLMSAGIAMMQPAMAAAVREWMPERTGFGTAVYSNGLIMGEIIPVATMLPLVMPLVDGNWRSALAVWTVPLVVMAAAVAIFAPKSVTNVVTTPAAGRLPRLNSAINWRIGLTLGSIMSAYFCLNGFMPARLNEIGHQDLVSAVLTALNIGQLPASFLLLLVADRLQGKRWPYLVLGALASSCVVAIMMSAGAWTVFWAALAGFSLGSGLVLGLALAPLLCDNANDVALTSAAALAIGYGFAMLISFLSGVVWDLAGHASAALIPILIGSLPIFIATPTFARRERVGTRAAVSSGKA